MSHHVIIEADFEVKIVKSHSSAFNRQISEGVLIVLNEADIPMNWKREFNYSNMPLLLVESNGIMGEECKRKNKK